MPIYISFLKGINVGGQKKIEMIKLKEVYQSLDFKNINTYIQSGNVVFDSRENDVSKIKRKIEDKIKAFFKFEVSVIIRTKDELENILNKNKFKNHQANTVYVTLLSELPSPVFPLEIEKSKGKSEEFYISGKEVYIFCPEGYGKTKLSNSFFEKKLKVSATTRNVKTLSALLDLALVSSSNL